MLTENQKREFEGLFNFYSLQREYDSELITEWSAKMWAFKTAVSILGYEFEYDHMEENNGVAYFSYKLVEIGKWVVFIDKQIDVGKPYREKIRRKEKKWHLIQSIMKIA